MPRQGTRGLGGLHWPPGPSRGANSKPLSPTITPLGCVATTSADLSTASASRETPQNTDTMPKRRPHGTATLARTVCTTAHQRSFPSYSRSVHRDATIATEGRLVLYHRDTAAGSVLMRRTSPPRLSHRPDPGLRPTRNMPSRRLPRTFRLRKQSHVNVVSAWSLIMIGQLPILPLNWPHQVPSSVPKALPGALNWSLTQDA